MAQRLTSRSKIKPDPKPRKPPKAAKPKKTKPTRVAPQVLADAVGGNLTDATIKEKLTGAVALKKDLDSANSAYRNHIKACKAVGLFPADVAWYLNAKTREPEDIDIETKRRNRIARVMRLPIGVQLGFWDTGRDKGKSVASLVENDKITETKAETTATETRKRSTNESLEKSMTAGETAGREGFDRKGNPHPEGSPEYLKWDYGWMAGDAERRSIEFNKAGTAAA